jgi:hypothetical protein
MPGLPATRSGHPTSEYAGFRHPFPPGDRTGLPMCPKSGGRTTSGQKAGPPAKTMLIVEFFQCIAKESTPRRISMERVPTHA